jgi:hypothetical protein
VESTISISVSGSRFPPRSLASPRIVKRVVMRPRDEIGTANARMRRIHDDSKRNRREENGDPPSSADLDKRTFPLSECDHLEIKRSLRPTKLSNGDACERVTGRGRERRRIPAYRLAMSSREQALSRRARRREKYRVYESVLILNKRASLRRKRECLS